ncbi:MAG: hypothetical protein M1818_003815 [Claussenomyces sp. TS43310]|nr:MAG: hypothetical protein M1818_003815 [Claussenomyces sp. TS43310]
MSSVFLSTAMAITFLSSTTLAESSNSAAAVSSKAAPSSATDTASTAASTSAAAASSTASAASTSTVSKTSSTTSLVFPTTIVPPTSDAPFMQSSTLPEGTVFIAVAGILAFLALVVIAWRGIIVWSLRRAVKRAALHTDRSDKKALFYTPAVPMTKYSDHDPKPSRKTKAHPGRPGAASTSNLFFSPTAGAAGSGLGAAGKHTSTYLPAGYYAAGAAVPGNGQGLAHLGRESVSLSNLGAQGQGYSRARSVGPTPPDSPSFAPNHSQRNLSSSTLDLGSLPNGRTPSAVLDDFFDGAGDAPPRRGGRS